MDETIAIIRQLAAERFYGALTLKFEAGILVYLKKEETIKTNHNYRNSRGKQVDETCK